MREHEPALRAERQLRVLVEPLVGRRDAAREREASWRRPRRRRAIEQRPSRPRAIRRPHARPSGGRPVRPARGIRCRRCLAAPAPRRCARRRRAVRLSGPSPWRGRPGRRGTASLLAPSGGLGYPPRMAANRVIGVDLGGTKILGGLVDADGNVHRTVERPTVTASQDSAARRARRAVVRELPHAGRGRRRPRRPRPGRPADRRGPRCGQHPDHRASCSRPRWRGGSGCRSGSRTTRTPLRTPSSASAPAVTSNAS